MQIILDFLASFLNVKRSIKAKIFVSMLIATMSITFVVTLFWYQTSVEATEKTVLENMSINMASAVNQIDNAVLDINRMHAIIVYETNSLQYIQNQRYNLPDSKWFTDYYKTLLNLQMMKAGLDRTVSGIAIMKTNGEVCMTGTMSINTYDMQAYNSRVTLFDDGTDSIFFLPKEYPTQIMPLYIYVGRIVQVGGHSLATIITRVNDSIFHTALASSTFGDGFLIVLNSNNDIIFDNSTASFTDAKNKMIMSLINTEDMPDSVSSKYFIIERKSDISGLTLLSAVPKTYVQNMSRHVTAQLSLILISVTILIAFVAFFISNKITRGIAILTRDMQKVASGSMSDLTQITTQDEIGQLNGNFINMIHEIKTLVQNIKDQENEKRTMEMKILRAQVSPHFLYNSLNTIKYLAVMQKVDNIQNLTAALIDLLQGAIAIDDTLIPLHAEMHYVKSYLSIQQYRFPQELFVEYSIDSVTDELLVPKMIMQPIVENALIHGLGNNKINGSIRIKAYIATNCLFISVTDNGIGMSQEKINAVMQTTHNNSKMRFSGIGIGNVDSRIKLQMGKDYGISIFSRQNMYTTVEIKLPIVRQDDSNARNLGLQIYDDKPNK